MSQPDWDKEPYKSMMSEFKKFVGERKVIYDAGLVFSPSFVHWTTLSQESEAAIAVKPIVYIKVGDMPHRNDS